MILVTGGTGFIGQFLVRNLVAIGRPTRILLRPSRTSPKLPKSVPVEVAVCSLRDERGLRAAMKGVDIIFHLAGSERQGSRADLAEIDINGTQTLVQIAGQSGVKRLIFLSHLGADRTSAYSLLKVKGLAENHIIKSGLDYTIIRTAPVYGSNDQFTTSLARLLKLSPGIFLLPGDGKTIIQPLWVEDLVAVMISCLEDDNTRNRFFSVGGPEYLRFFQVIEFVMEALDIQRQVISINVPLLRILSLWVEQTFFNFPISIFWLDYLAVDRTCTLDTLPRYFGINPARFQNSLDYLKHYR